MKIIEKYAYYKLHKKARTIKRRVVLPHPGSVGKVGVLWQPSQREAFNYLHDHFYHKQTIFRNFCIFPEDSSQATGTNVLSPKDIDWLGFPKPGPADEFINTEFDLLLNIALEQNFVLDYITALSRAKFKIGWSPVESNFFDLNIAIGENPDALFLAKQQIFYLTQLNKTT